MCKTEQKISNHCVNINCQFTNQFTLYYCYICKLHNNTEKDIYHCDQCGICRIGLKEKNFHCENCNMCYLLSAKNNHQCFNNKFDMVCSICRENLFRSRHSAINFNKCPHSMCSFCFDQYIKNEYKCPICNKSIIDMSNLWESIDAIMLNDIMPEEYKQTTTNILCNDCNTLSKSIRYHFQYHKCDQCGSYNTNIT